SYLQSHLIGPAIQLIKNYFSEGNLFVRVGMLVLFFGVAFLLKYAAEHSVFPIELRISAIALAAMAVLYVGWRLRANNQTYGLILQGGSIGVLYMTFYAAYQMYQLIPSLMAFGLMLLLAICSALLAVYQNARVLAVLGAVGGFLAPLLASSGADNYVGLFSYYLLLNLGILTVGWFKSWRILNLIGFGFTYVIAGYWGVLSYQPEKFWTTEPFLILFFLTYISVSILYALRQTINLKAYVDASLLFGNPLLAFGYQLALVKDFEYGIAISAFVLGVFYIVLGRVLWQKQGEKLRMMVEACLAIGVVFVTLAIPFALDANWTSAAWAMEAAGILWVGLKQGRKVTPVFAILLQIAAAVMFLDHGFSQAGPVFLANASFIGSLIIAVAGLFSAWLLQQESLKNKPHVLLAIKPLVYLWGLGWWILGVLMQIDVHFVHAQSVNALLLASMITALLAWLMDKRLNWYYARLTTLALVPALVLVGLYAIELFSHPLAEWGYLYWLAALVFAYALLKHYSENTTAVFLLPSLHVALAWLFTLVLTLDINWQLSTHLASASGWRAIYWLAIAIPMMLLVIRRSFWPFTQYARAYVQGFGMPMFALIVVWMVASSLNSNGDAMPLSYIPLFNPLDMMQLYMLVLMLRFWRSSRELLDLNAEQNRLMLIVTSAMAFLWINMLLVRIFHQFFDVAFIARVLWQTEALQSSLSILWAVLGMLGMVIASRRHLRPLWLVGAVLTAVVVLKLMTIDLAASGTIERIVSFLVVGSVLVIMGYFSPIPPKPVNQS
ncbi:MAG: DUF2339 domain-containing protein, partial [Gammaproteobacteria bacterium]|nr:DUF2339 domain-containing protein [Gammaproteobacteria bacterium]